MYMYNVVDHKKGERGAERVVGKSISTGGYSSSQQSIKRTLNGLWSLPLNLS